MFDLWKDELTDEEADALLDKAAAAIHKRKLEVPAVLMLEMHKPLANVGGHAAVAFAPMLVPIFGFDNVNKYSKLFSERSNIEKLLVKIERGCKEAPREEA